MTSDVVKDYTRLKMDKSIKDLGVVTCEMAGVNAPLTKKLMRAIG
jgi:hypothetical protein